MPIDKKKNSYISINDAMGLLFPIGGLLYIDDANFNPNTAYSGTTWELISKGRCIMGADDTHACGTTTEAGLPNIEGATDIGGFSGHETIATGPFAGSEYVLTANHTVQTVSKNDTDIITISFNASRANPIYGASSTVQPPAYFVNIWKRTA